MLDTVISVRQLNLYVKSLIDGDKRLNYISVCGEISNFKSHYASGHWYFTVKDNDAALKCLMFKAFASRASFVPKDGMSVVVSGRVSIYEKDGQYQLYAESVMPYGEGDLSLAFRLVKEKLQKEGLFDEENKRPINKRPKRVAVLTSDTGAAIKDICSTFEKRYPICELVICPVTVQGEKSAKDIISSLERVYSLQGVDTVIIARGGGSAEDLAPFNDEALARKIYESPFPVISAVGHETDFTICDFVSDARAATPTAAAVIACDDILQIRSAEDNLRTRLIRNINALILNKSLNLKLLSEKIKNPETVIAEKLQKNEYLKKQLNGLMNSRLQKDELVFSKCLSELDALSPLKTLSRGFSVVSKDKKVITKTNDVDIGDSISVLLADGGLICDVKEKTNGKI